MKWADAEVVLASHQDAQAAEPGGSALLGEEEPAAEALPTFLPVLPLQPPRQRSSSGEQLLSHQLGFRVSDPHGYKTHLHLQHSHCWESFRGINALCVAIMESYAIDLPSVRTQM